MRSKRHKYVKKVLNFYRNYFEFNSPYRIIIDGTFCKSALDAKINITEHVRAYVDDQIDIYCTPCTKLECELFGKILSGPLQLLRQFPEYSCNHDPPKTAVSCLLSLTKERNKEKLILASQDVDLLEKGRKKIGVPLMLLSHNSAHLEKPTPKSQRAAQLELSKKLLPSDYQRSSLVALKRTVLGEVEEESITRRRKIKGPNPLACKPRNRKTNSEYSSTNGVGHTRRKRRHRMRVSPHLKEPLKELVLKLRAENG